MKLPTIFPMWVCLLLALTTIHALKTPPMLLGDDSTLEVGPLHHHLYDVIGSPVGGIRQLKDDPDAPFCCDGAICGKLCAEHLTGRCHPHCCRSPACSTIYAPVVDGEPPRSACLYVINQCDHTILVGVTAFKSVHTTLNSGEAACIAQVPVSAGTRFVKNKGYVSIFYEDTVDGSSGIEWTGSACATFSSGKVCWVDVRPYHRSPGYKQILPPGEEKLIWTATCA